MPGVCLPVRRSRIPRSWRFASIPSGLLLVASILAPPAHAADAWLTWSSSGIVSDLATPGAASKLFVRLQGVSSFKGAELDLTWNPLGDGANCATIVSTLYRTSTDCTYLNRGSVVPIVTVDAPGHYHVAWANSLGNTDCVAGGNAVELDFAYDGCANPAGCISLNCLQVIDETNALVPVAIVGHTATILGGSAFCAVNHPPVFDPLPALTTHEGSLLTFSVSASDPDFNCPLYSASALPLGATFDGTAFVWTPGLGQAGTYAPVFTANDGFGGSASWTATVTVTADHAPRLDPPAARGVKIGDLLAVDFSATDPDGDALVLSAADLPLGATLSGFTLRWIPTADQVGEYDIPVTATDPAGLSATASLHVTVYSSQNQSPVFTPVDSQSVDELHLLVFTVLAVDPEGQSVTYGSGSLPEGATFAGQTFQWTPTLGQSGTYFAAFTAQDASGAVGNLTVEITVRGQVPPEIADIPDQQVETLASLTIVLSATDANGDTPLVFIAGGLPPGATLTDSVFTWIPQARQVGTYHVQFYVTDIANFSDYTTATITVVPRPTAFFVDRTSLCTPCDARTWATAVHSIQEGIAQTFDGLGDSVLIATGSYGERSLQPRSRSALLGGYPVGGGRARDPQTSPVIVTPVDPVAPFLIQLQRGPQIAVDGLTFAGVRGGSGVIVIDAAGATLRQVTCTRNTVVANGPVVAIRSASLGTTLDRCIIARNTVMGAQGAITVERGAVVDMTDCTVTLDSTRAGQGTPGIGIVGTATVRNSIVGGFRPATLPAIVVASGGSVTVSYCDVSGGWTGTGNLNVDPKFCDARHGVFTLQASSPCIGAGEGGTTIGALDTGCAIGAPQGADGASDVTGIGASAPMPDRLGLRVDGVVAHGAVSLRMDLPATGTVDLEVFNATGKRVATLMREARGPGSYAVRWDAAETGARPAAAGLYLIRLRQGSEERRARVVLMSR